MVYFLNIHNTAEEKNNIHNTAEEKNNKSQFIRVTPFTIKRSYISTHECRLSARPGSIQWKPGD